MHYINLVFSFLFYSIPLCLLSLFLVILGIIIVPFALLFSTKEINTTKQQFNGWEYRQLPKWAWIWDNTIYGTMGNTDFISRDRNPFYKNPTGFMSQYYWLVFRNPTNNFEQWKYSSVDLRECSPIAWIGKEYIDNDISGFQFVWCYPKNSFFPRVGLYFMLPIFKSGRAVECRIGFKLNPKHNGTNRERRVGLTIIINLFKGFDFDK